MKWYRLVNQDGWNIKKFTKGSIYFGGFIAEGTNYSVSFYAHNFPNDWEEVIKSIETPKIKFLE